jgi:hypothetical protein
MTLSLHKFLKKPLRRIEFGVKSVIARVLQFLFRKINPSICVSFDSSKSFDGTGAQLQRQATVMAVAKYFGFTYVPTEIRQVSVHPLDPFRSEPEYKSYLERLNRFLKVDSSSVVVSLAPDVRLTSLTFSRLIRECFYQILWRRERNFLIYEPYPVSEFCPKIMDNLQLQCNESLESDRTQAVFEIVIHYRQGVGGFVLYPGQNIPREIPIEVFAARVRKIALSLPEDLERQIIVVTDAPDTETVFVPPTNQLALWEGTPGFSNGVMTIKPTKFEELEELSNLPLKVLRGGNPLDTILLMASADVLLTGKSSLSYLGGLLNPKGQVYFPKDFWHRPLRNWQVL